MATIIQSPDTLSFSRNLKEIILSSFTKIDFFLKKEDRVLIEESYLPDATNRIRIDVRDVVDGELSLAFPSEDITVQNDIIGNFSFGYGIDPVFVTKSFTVIRGGVERMSDSAEIFLKSNFLTWQPQSKEVTYNQPEWITFYVSDSQYVLKARFYHTDGSTADAVITSSGEVFSVGDIVTVNMQFARIWQIGDGDRYGYFDVWAEDGHGTKLTYTQRYILRTGTALDKYYCCANSLGGLDSFRFSGDLKFSPETDFPSVLLGDILTADSPENKRIWSQNTGMLDRLQERWVWELFRSSQAWHLRDGVILPIVLKAAAVESSEIESLNHYNFDYVLSKDDGLLNIQRTSALPDNIEIPGPDGHLFFLIPRLIEYPDAALEDSWLIPLQSGFEEKWYRTSVGGLKKYLLDEIEDRYSHLLHSHDNLGVLNGFSTDQNGSLLWNGKHFGSNEELSGSFVTIDTAQTITGKKTFAAEQLFNAGLKAGYVKSKKLYVPSVTGDGDAVQDGIYDLSIDSSSAVSGEAPSGGGGMDIDALWIELSGSASDKVIDKSHLPSSIVYADSLATALESYYTKSQADSLFAPVSHSHTTSDISGLQTALDSKAAAVHSHNYLSTLVVGTKSYSVLGNKVTIPAYPTSLKSPYPLSISLCDGMTCGTPQEYDGSAELFLQVAAGMHTHPTSDISGLQTALDSKAAAVHSHNYLSTLVVGTKSYSVLGNKITIPAYPTSLKSPYPLSISLCDGMTCGTPQEYDGSAELFLQVAAGMHTHPTSDISGLQTALDSKAAAVHSHNYLSTLVVGTKSYSVLGNKVTIPAYPTSLKSPYPLSISLCDGLSCGLPQSYDGSAEMTLMLATGNHTHTPGDVGIKWAGNISSSGIAKKSCGKYEITVTKLGNGRFQISASGFDLNTSLVLVTPLASGFCTATFGGGTIYLRDSASTYFNVGVNLLIM